MVCNFLVNIAGTRFSRSPPPKPTLGSGGGWNWRKINGSRLVSQNTMMIRQKVFDPLLLCVCAPDRKLICPPLDSFSLCQFVCGSWKYGSNMITRFQCFHEYICTRVLIGQ